MKALNFVVKITPILKSLNFDKIFENDKVVFIKKTDNDLTIKISIYLLKCFVSVVVKKPANTRQTILKIKTHADQSINKILEAVEDWDADIKTFNSVHVYYGNLDSEKASQMQYDIYFPDFGLTDDAAYDILIQALINSPKSDIKIAISNSTLLTYLNGCHNLSKYNIPVNQLKLELTPIIIKNLTSNLEINEYGINPVKSDEMIMKVNRFNMCINDLRYFFD